MKSMTGYGNSHRIIGDYDITCEIATVNHRYFDHSLKISNGYGFLDNKIKSYVKKYISRGRIEINIIVRYMGENSGAVCINEAKLTDCLNSLKTVSEKFGLANDLKLTSVLRFPGIFEETKRDINAEKMWDSLKTVLDETLLKLNASRITEGKVIKKDFVTKIANLKILLSQIEKLSPKTIERYREKILSNLCKITNCDNLNEQRIITEIAVLAERISIDEEIVRLKSHTKQLEQLIELTEPIGKKIDFLMQEFNREVNTIASKANDTAVIKHTLEMKSNIENIREQIQNIE